jgi:DNA-binding CsgD family transcriptional regulator
VAARLQDEGSDMPLEEAIAAGLDPRPEDAWHVGTSPGLTDREREIAVLVARGMANREIAEQLVLSVRTVETHVGRVLTKLGFDTRSRLSGSGSPRGLVAEGALPRDDQGPRAEAHTDQFGHVRLGGIAMTSLVIGFLPVAVTIVGSRDIGAVPLRRLIPSLALSALGAVCIGWEALTGPTSESVLKQAVGLLCAVGALISWTCYAVGNSRWLMRLDHVSPHEWNILTGVVTGAQAVLLIPLAFVLATESHATPAWAKLGTAKAMITIRTFRIRMMRLYRLLVQLTRITPIIPAAWCSRMWQWNIQSPGLSATNAISTVSRGAISTVSCHSR